MVGSSIISAQEKFGYNEQFDYWAFAIVHEAVFDLANLHAKILYQIGKMASTLIRSMRRFRVARS